MLVKQQEKIKEKEGFYYEFELDTKEITLIIQMVMFFMLIALIQLLSLNWMIMTQIVLN
jgi:hypothetical protein